MSLQKLDTKPEIKNKAHPQKDCNSVMSINLTAYTVLMHQLCPQLSTPALIRELYKH